MRVLLGRGWLGVDLVDGVVVTVHVEVQPDVEEVLVVRRAQVLPEATPVARPLAVCEARGQDDARELHLALDRAVLVQVPVEGVLVVVRRSDRRDDEPARAPHLDVAGHGVRVLPEEAEVLLVQADRVLDRVRAAGVVGERRVEVVDLAEAVAAELERVGEGAEAVLADVEGVAPVAARAGVSVRHEQLRERGPVEDRAAATAVVVAQRVQHEPLARGEPDAQ